MYLKELSIWGCLLVLLLLLVAMLLLWLIDQRMLRKLFGFRLRGFHLPAKLLLPVGVAVLVGGAAMAGCLALCLPCRTFWPVYGLMVIGLLLSVPRAMQTYHRSLKHTEAHRLYLIANGATHLESLVPSVRRAFRAALLPVAWRWSSPLVVAMPFLLLGLLIGGVTPAAALATTVLMWVAVVAASVLSSALAMWLADFFLFKKPTEPSGKL